MTDRLPGYSRLLQNGLVCKKEDYELYESIGLHKALIGSV